MNQQLQELVHRHRDAPSPALSIDWALLRLLDQPACQQLTADLQEQGNAWEVQTATPNAWQTIPDEPGLYMFVWRPYLSFAVEGNCRPAELTQVLYVGKAGAGDDGSPNSSTLRARYRSYENYLRGDPATLWKQGRSRTRDELLSRYLTLKPLEHWFTVVPRQSEIPLLEDRLIKFLNPPCNRQRLPTLVLGSPSPAFQ